MDHRRLRSHVLSLLTLMALAFMAGPLSAQREGYSYLSYVGSEVSLVSKSEEDSTARINMPIGPGDKLTTGRSSRAEAILADGTVVRFDSRTEVRFDRLAQTHETDDDRDLVFLQNGALAVEVRGRIDEERAIRIDTDDATVVLSERGVFRVDAGRRGTEVYALSGTAKVMARGGQATVHAGEFAFVSGPDAIDVEAGELPNDRFTRFVQERRIRPRRDREDGGVRTMAEAGAAEYDYDYDASGMDDSGSWAYVASLGRNCWRPRVGADWRPYSQGYWRSSPCGLTWVSYEPWGWLPYHYGTWSFDTGFGWCWLPGASYSPAWVYWNYTPSYLGWCPVGYYGYYDNYYRSTRTWFGDGRGLTYPHLRGAVDVTQVSAGGWNYAQIPTIGTRLSARDVIRGDRVSFRPGEIGMIATAPLRLDRAGQSRIAIQEAVRRVSISEGLGQGARGTLPVNSGLTSILRRQVSLTPEGQEELRRSAVQVGRDPGYHPLPAEQIALGRRTDISGRTDISTRGGSASGGLQSSGEVEQRRGNPGTSGGTAVRPSDSLAPRSSWRETRPRITEGSPRIESPGRRDDASRPSPRTDEGWRSRGSSSAPRTVEPRREERAAPRRNDGGWRSPRADTPRSRDDSPRREAPAPRTETPRSESRREPPPSPRSYEAPRHEAPAPRSEAPRSAPRAEPPAPRPEPRRESSSSSQRFESRTPTGSSSEGRPYASNRIEPRMESQVPRRYEAPAYRSYESPRPSAPAPRVSQPMYQAPARNESRPAPQASALQGPAPQAPRGEARARTF